MLLRYAFLTVFLIAVCADSPARAYDYYVSASGSNSNSCNSSTSPCLTLDGALGKTAVNDTIVCLGPVASGALQITKSIEIDCSGGPAELTQVYYVDNNEQISINIPVSAGDPFRTVRLRGVTVVSYQQGIRIDRGIDIKAASAVFLEHVIVSGAGKQGIFDERTGGQGRLYVTDSIIRDGTGPGIVAAAPATSITVLDNVRLENNLYGLAAATGNNVVISRSVLSGNTTAGVEGDPGAQIVVDNSTISHNVTGVHSNSSVRISNNNIAFNGTAISGSSGTFGNNRFSGNGTIGTPPSPLGGASSDLGQQ